MSPYIQLADLDKQQLKDNAKILKEQYTHLNDT